MAYKFENLETEYAANWAQAVTNPARDAEFAAVVRRMIAGMPQYEAVAKATGVPAAVIAVIHQREAGGDFTTHLHNGDPLSARTVHVPAGRPVAGAPPFSWTASAMDALRYEGLDKIGAGDWTVARACFVLEGYNGFGYRNRGLRSPYLYGGTTLQQPGKYVADGVFDPNVLDRQLGCVGLLKALFRIAPEYDWTKAASAPVPLPTPRPTPTPTPRPTPPASRPILDFIVACIKALFGVS